MINAVVLAGDSKKDAVQQGVANKALLPIHGRPMIRYVVEALRSAPSIGMIAVIGPESLLKAHLQGLVDIYLEGRDSLFDNLAAGMEPFAADKAVLVVTSDIPMIRGEMVEDLLARCLEKDGDLGYPVVEKALNDARFPGMERTYVRLREGRFTGGNIVYVSPAAVKRCADFARKVIAYRKKPLKAARLLGIGFLIRLISGRLTIAQAEARFSRLLNISAHAIITPYPEVGNDVDKPSDVEMVQRYLHT